MSLTSYIGWLQHISMYTLTDFVYERVKSAIYVKMHSLKWKKVTYYKYCMGGNIGAKNIYKKRKKYS